MEVTLMFPHQKSFDCYAASNRLVGLEVRPVEPERRENPLIAVYRRVSTALDAPRNYHRKMTNRNEMEVRNTRDRLLQVGLRHIRSMGYASTGVQEILNEADVPKGSFYHHFARSR